MSQQGIDLTPTTPEQVAEQIRLLDVPTAIYGVKLAFAMAVKAYAIWQAMKAAQANSLVDAESAALLEGVKGSILNIFGDLFKDKILDWIKNWMSDPVVQKAIFDKLSEVLTSLLNSFLKK